MVDKQKLLDEVMRREKTRTLRRIFKYSAFILIFGAIYTFSQYKNYDRVKFSKELNGVVETVNTSTSRDLETQTIFIVKLENEKRVKIIKDNKVPVKAATDKPVIIKKGETVKVLREEAESGLLKYSIIFD